MRLRSQPSRIARPFCFRHDSGRVGPPAADARSGRSATAQFGSHLLLHATRSRRPRSPAAEAAGTEGSTRPAKLSGVAPRPGSGCQRGAIGGWRGGGGAPPRRTRTRPAGSRARRPSRSVTCGASRSRSSTAIATQRPASWEHCTTAGGPSVSDAGRWVADHRKPVIGAVAPKCPLASSARWQRRRPAAELASIVTTASAGQHRLTRGPAGLRRPAGAPGATHARGPPDRGRPRRRRRRALALRARSAGRR
jgi:hypothetical protein